MASCSKSGLNACLKTCTVAVAPDPKIPELLKVLSKNGESSTIISLLRLIEVTILYSEFATSVPAWSLVLNFIISPTEKSVLKLVPEPVISSLPDDIVAVPLDFMSPLAVVPTSLR